MELNNTLDLARGLISGWMIDQVNNRGDLPLKGGLAVGLAGLLLAVFASGWWRAPGVILLIIGLAVFFAVWLVQRVAKFAISRFATPRSLAGQHQEIQNAIDAMDLPTSPLAILRFLNRIKKGPGPELDRIQLVVRRLSDRLDVAES